MYTVIRSVLPDDKNKLEYEKVWLPELVLDWTLPPLISILKVYPDDDGSLTSTSKAIEVPDET